MEHASRDKTKNRHTPEGRETKGSALDESPAGTQEKRTKKNRSDGEKGKECHEREREAAKTWTRIAEGEDAYAVTLVRDMGYARALEWVSDSRGSADRGLAKAVARWQTRLADLDEKGKEAEAGLEFTMPGDSLWPEALDDLGDVRPLGLWFRGTAQVLARTGVAIVGSRDSSPYGIKIATDAAYEMADTGVNIVSGGAFGIDAAAHRGALAADGYTIAISACGADRYYPSSHADLYLDILRRGGVICSEAPPGAAPYKHRFLSRNRIIAALARATVVVEAPFRSGALSTAHHAMSIGRPIGVFPGPVTSPRSAGCHRLLREGATCVTSVSEILELMGMDAQRADKTVPHGKSTAGGRGTPGQPWLFDQSPRNSKEERQLMLDVLDPLASRVCEALPVARGASVGTIASVAGVSVAEALAGLGRLERHGMAVRNAGLWKLSRKVR